MSIVFSKPYEFVPPHRGDRWPSFIQLFRLYEYHLRRSEGVVGYETRGIERWKACLDAGDGIVLAPNHCRYADPLVLGWPARDVGTHVFAMASWHLFNRKKFDSFALQKMGAFSLHREGRDRQAIDTAIDVLTNAERPLIMFPEGGTLRTNDELMPLLDGVTFIARKAARRVAKAQKGTSKKAPSSPAGTSAKRPKRVVILPVAIKYVCQDDIFPWADQALAKIEADMIWKDVPHRFPAVNEAGLRHGIVERCRRLANLTVSLKETQYGVIPSQKAAAASTLKENLCIRRAELIEQLLRRCESTLELPDHGGVRDRVRTIRIEISSRFFASHNSTNDNSTSHKTQHKDPTYSPEMLRYLSGITDDVIDLNAYPADYLDVGVTDTRIVETIQRFQEWRSGKADRSVRLRAIIQFDDPIEVPPEKAPKGEEDPLLISLRGRLQSMLSTLSTLALPIE